MPVQINKEDTIVALQKKIVILRDLHSKKDGIIAKLWDLLSLLENTLEEYKLLEFETLKSHHISSEVEKCAN